MMNCLETSRGVRSFDSGFAFAQDDNASKLPLYRRRKAVRKMKVFLFLSCMYIDKQAGWVHNRVRGSIVTRWDKNVPDEEMNGGL